MLVGRLRLLGRFWKKAWRDEKWMLNMTCKSNGKRCKQRSSKDHKHPPSPTSIKKHHQSWKRCMDKNSGNLCECVHVSRGPLRINKTAPEASRLYTWSRTPRVYRPSNTDLNWRDGRKCHKCLSQSAPRVLTSERISDATSLVALLRHTQPRQPFNKIPCFFPEGFADCRSSTRRPTPPNSCSVYWPCHFCQWSH